MKKIPKYIISGAALCLAVLALVIYLAISFSSQWKAEPIYPGQGVTDIKMLSHWFPALEGTRGDTEVYILDSGIKGGSMLVLGGTHPNEPSGFVSAVAIIEYCRPAAGVLYVIPRANNSAFSCTDPQEAAPAEFFVETKNGKRRFRFGSRATNPVDQWPDSEVYVHASSGQKLSGSETRNLNRAYPGRRDGTFTEKIAYGITELIKIEGIDVTVDLHEASPEYTTVNAIVAHENAVELAAFALWGVEDFMQISVEQSPPNLHGLTHRELGDFTDTVALLMETANPSQGRLHGKIDKTLVVTGKDKFYTRASLYGALTVPYDESGISLSERCARHISCLVQFAENYAFINPEGVLSLGYMPSYDQIIENGIGYYLSEPEE
ncbi:MAG: succinylglutamate desuccinylase [Spirochaetales bacterium]